MSNLTSKIQLLADEYAKEVKEIFPNDDPIVLLYGSAVEGVENSDLDLCTIVHNYNKDDIKKIATLTKEFHKKNNMKLDDEVPFENKVLYSFFDINRITIKPPFQIYRRKFYIPKIEKNENILNSQEIKDRLLIYAMTSNSQVICGNEKVLIEYRKKVWEMLIKVIIFLYR